jgi:hypothetical protein
MAYSRFFNSDIYIYPSVLGDIVCSGCLLGSKSVHIESDIQLLAHIQDHRDAGHDIPDDLEQEILIDEDRYRDLQDTSSNETSSLEFDQE